MATREPAPEPLLHVQRFVNTYDVEEARETLDSPAALREWLLERELLDPGETVRPADVGRAHAVREAFRALLASNHGAPLDPGAVATLDRASERARLRLRFLPDGGARVEPCTRGVDAALGRLIAVAHAAMADGTWDRLKVCRSGTCAWAFYDNSRNRSGSWCAMGVCGNREKVRSYRRRHRAG